MNKVILCGRLARDPETRQSKNENSMAITRYTLAVDRRTGKGKDSNTQTADFIPCVAFGKLAEFAEKYFTKGLRVLVSGRIQTGSYTNRDGQKVYTTEVVVEEEEFADGKQSAQPNQGYDGNRQENPKPSNPVADAGFMNVPDGFESELPFS